MFFSTGCNDDEDNDDTIPVSEYPESILGHWRFDSHANITITQNIEIDPVFGTETITTEQEEDFTSYSPFSPGFYFLWEQPIRTFKYDGNYEWSVFETDSIGNVLDQPGISHSYGTYEVDGENIIYSTGPESRIEYLSNNNLQIKTGSSDTLMLNQIDYPNSNPGDYTITQNINYYNYSRLDELPFELIPSTNSRNSPTPQY